MYLGIFNIKPVIVFVLTITISCIRLQANAHTLTFFFKDSVEHLYIIKHDDYIQDVRQQMGFKKIALNEYQLEYNGLDTFGIIFKYKNRYSNPYYLTPHENNSVRLVIHQNQVSIQCNPTDFNYWIQKYDDELYGIARGKKRITKKHVQLVSALMDSILPLVSNFAAKSIRFQFYGFQYFQMYKANSSERAFIQFSKSLPYQEVDPRISVMMAFFISSNHKLWFAAQHTQLNKQFLDIRNKNHLEDVIFKQHIFSHEEYENLSRVLRLKLVYKASYYHGDRADLVSLLDSIAKITTVPYIKQLCKNEVDAINQVSKENYGSLTDYPFLDRNKNTINIDTFLGKVVLIDFWATWCGPCIRGFSKLKQLQQKYPDKLTIISLNVDDNIDKMIKFLGNRPDLNWVFLYNGLNESVMSRFGVVSYPHYGVLDKNGKIIYKSIDVDEIEQILKKYAN